MAQSKRDHKTHRHASDDGAAASQAKADTPAEAQPDGGPPADGGQESRRIEQRPIAGLNNHPWQVKLYHSLEGADFEGLVNSFRREGQREAIQVTPDGTIIDGHQRVRAADQLGWSEIRVWVRDDLAGDQDAIDRAHVLANRDRRQLDTIDRVRLALRLEEIERGRKVASLSDSEQEEFRERIGKSVGLSGRHVQRYLNVLDLPMVLQRAVSKGRLGLVMADRISRLRWRVQQKIADEIEAGGDPKKVVAKHSSFRGRGSHPTTKYRQMMLALAQGLDAAEGRYRELYPVNGLEGDLALMDRLGRFREEFAEERRRSEAEFEQALQEDEALFAQHEKLTESLSGLA